MLDSKFMITLIGFVVAIVAVFNSDISPSITEGFWNVGSFTTKVVKDYGCLPKYATPVIDNSDYRLKKNCGPNICYKQLSNNNHQPMHMSEMVNNNYSLKKPESVKPVNYGLELGMSDIYDSNKEDTVSMPISDMNSVDVTCENPIIFDRHIFAPQKSNLARNGDVFRGDIFIPPANRGGWFDVYPTSNDHTVGAMNIMGGFDNQSNNVLVEHMYKESGRTQTVFGGVDLQDEFVNINGITEPSNSFTSYV